MQQLSAECLPLYEPYFQRITSMFLSSEVHAWRQRTYPCCDVPLIPIHCAADPSKPSKKGAAVEEEESAGTARQRQAELKLLRKKEAERKAMSSYVQVGPPLRTPHPHLGADAATCGARRRHG